MSKGQQTGTVNTHARKKKTKKKNRDIFKLSNIHSFFQSMVCN